MAGFALPVLGSGCAYGEVRQVLRAQFASEIGCADVQLKRRDAWYAAENPHQYKIIGCGVTRSYTCTNEQAEGLVSYDEPACTWVEGDSDAPKPKTMPTEGDEMMDAPMDGEPPMDEPPMDEPPMDEPSEPEADDDLEGDMDSEADVEADAPKGKAKAKGSFKLGGD